MNRLHAVAEAGIIVAIALLDRQRTKRPLIVCVRAAARWYYLGRRV